MDNNLIYSENRYNKFWSTAFINYNMKNNKNSTLSLTTITHVTTDQGYLETCHERSGCEDEGPEGKVQWRTFPRHTSYKYTFLRSDVKLVCLKSNTLFKGFEQCIHHPVVKCMGNVVWRGTELLQCNGGWLQIRLCVCIYVCVAIPVAVPTAEERNSTSVYRDTTAAI